MDDVTVHRADGAAVSALLDRMAVLYGQVYEHGNGPADDVAEFVERTTRQAQRPGFALIYLMAGEELVGFSFGLTVDAGAWWRGEATPPSAEILASEKFAVIELVLRSDYRGHGLGRRLMDELLAGRSEPYAILTAVPTAPARRIYERWGWQQIGTAHHSPSQPVMDQLVLRLHS